MFSNRYLRSIPLKPTSLLSGTDNQVDIKSHNLHRTSCSSLDVWEYGPGEFDWQSDAAQSAWVLTGSANVDLSDGRSLQLGPGDTFYLPQGLHGHWVIEKALRAVTIREKE
ncbi:MAG: cupin domain-containing protein [Pseudomonadota bacterium]